MAEIGTIRQELAGWFSQRLDYPMELKIEMWVTG